MKEQDVDFYGSFLTRLQEYREQAEQQESDLEILISTTESLYELIGDRDDDYAKVWRDVADNLSLVITESYPRIELPESLQTGSARMAEHIEVIERRAVSRKRLQAVGRGFIKMFG
jgi:hypothetical protein